APLTAGTRGVPAVNFVQDLAESRRIRRAARLEIALEAAGRAEAADRGRIEGDSNAAANSAGPLVQFSRDDLRLAVAVLPRLQDDEERCRAALRAAADEIVAV